MELRMVFQHFKIFGNLQGTVKRGGGGGGGEGGAKKRGVGEGGGQKREACRRKDEKITSTKSLEIPRGWQNTGKW